MKLANIRQCTKKDGINAEHRCVWWLPAYSKILTGSNTNGTRGARCELCLWFSQHQFIIILATFQSKHESCDKRRAKDDESLLPPFTTCFATERSINQKQQRLVCLMNDVILMAASFFLTRYFLLLVPWYFYNCCQTRGEIFSVDFYFSSFPFISFYFFARSLPVFKRLFYELQIRSSFMSFHDCELLKASLKVLRTQLFRMTSYSYATNTWTPDVMSIKKTRLMNDSSDVWRMFSVMAQN